MASSAGVLGVRGVASDLDELPLVNVVDAGREISVGREDEDELGVVTLGRALATA